MLKQSFLKKCAAADCCLSIGIPKGVAICVVIDWKWPWDHSIRFRFENGGMIDPMLDVDCINASSNKRDNMWIAYVPFSLLENMHHKHNHDDDDYDDCECEDWYRIMEGNLIIELTSDTYVERFGATFVYKEEVESTQQFTKPSISSSYYWYWKLTHDELYRNTIKCI